MFTVTWCQIAMFSCTDSIATSQVVMYEGSDRIDMFIESKPLCAGWNGGNAVQGLVNLGSTVADIVFDILGLDEIGQISGQHMMKVEFIPNGSIGYTINQIPYVLLLLIEHMDKCKGDIGYGPTLPVNISSTTTYYADTVGSCSSELFLMM